MPGGSVSSGVTSWGQFVASSENIKEDDRELDSSSNGKSESYIRALLAPQKKDFPPVKYTKKKGRITLQMSHESLDAPKSNQTMIASTPNRTSQQPGTFSISVDPFAAFRLLGIFVGAFRHFLAAFVCTLKLLGPLIFARRVLAQVGELVADYLMGRYLRTTYERVERKYWKEYQGPAALRSLGRCFAHTVSLLVLGKFMEGMVGLGYPPCAIKSKTKGQLSCHWWCGLLWIVAVVGAGNFIAALVSEEVLATKAELFLFLCCTV